MQPKKHKQSTEGSLEGPGRVSTGQRSFLVPGQVSHFWSLFFPAPGQKSHLWSLFFSAFFRCKAEKKRQKCDFLLGGGVDPPQKCPRKWTLPQKRARKRARTWTLPKIDTNCARKPGWVVPFLLAILFAVFVCVCCFYDCCCFSGCNLWLLFLLLFVCFCDCFCFSGCILWLLVFAFFSIW